MTYKSFFFGLLFLPVIFGVDFDNLAPLLRSQSLKCKSIFQQAYCQLKCDDKKPICVKDNCICISAAVSEPKEFKRKHDNEYEIDENDFVDGEESEVQDQTRIDSVPIYALRPTVRHHIAHFCPNLEVAKECIRKCMAEGKPAFCGKDHVCYCGHKYDHTNNKPDIDVKKMYAQFHDLYTKYFGPDNSVEISAS